MNLPAKVRILPGETRERAQARKDRLIRKGLLVTVEEIRREEARRKQEAMKVIEEALGSFEDRPL